MGIETFETIFSEHVFSTVCQDTWGNMAHSSKEFEDRTQETPWCSFSTRKTSARRPASVGQVCGLGSPFCRTTCENMCYRAIISSVTRKKTCSKFLPKYLFGFLRRVSWVLFSEPSPAEPHPTMFSRFSLIAGPGSTRPTSSLRPVEKVCSRCFFGVEPWPPMVYCFTTSICHKWCGYPQISADGFLCK